MVYISIITIVTMVAALLALLIALCKAYECLATQKRIARNYEDIINNQRMEIEALKKFIKLGENE